MNGRITFGTVVALACSAAIALGLPQQSTPSPRPPAKTDEKPATLVGCVQAGAAPGQFVLTTSLAPDAKPASPGSTDKAIKYELVGQGEVDLQKLVGKKVEVTGTLSSTPTLSRYPDPAPGASARIGHETIMKVVVRSAKDLAPSC